MNMFVSKYKIPIKVIAIIVACLFLINTVAWAYPDQIRENTLSVESGFQVQRMNNSGDAKSFQESLLFDGNLLFTVSHAAKYLLEEKQNIEFFRDVMTAELPPYVLSKIDFAKITVKDGGNVVVVPYTVQGDKQRLVQVALRGGMVKKIFWDTILKCLKSI